MKRAMIILASVTSFAIGVWLFNQIVINETLDYNTWVETVIIVVPIAAGFRLLAWSTSGNLHNIREGTVIEHRFIPAGASPMVVNTITVNNTPITTVTPPIPYDASWGIRLQRADGKTGWINFNEDVLDKYPVGSYQSL